VNVEAKSEHSVCKSKTDDEVTWLSWPRKFSRKERRHGNYWRTWKML